MKLELKPEQIYPYLPYKLKLVWNKGVNTIEMHPDNVTHVINLVNDGVDREDRWKLILRKLSDVTNEELELFGCDESTLRVNVWAQKTEIGLWNELLEKHFDLFDLIKNNLAIDINTI